MTMRFTESSYSQFWQIPYTIRQILSYGLFLSFFFILGATERLEYRLVLNNFVSKLHGEYLQNDDKNTDSRCAINSQDSEIRDAWNRILAAKNNSRQCPLTRAARLSPLSSFSFLRTSHLAVANVIVILFTLLWYYEIISKAHERDPMVYSLGMEPCGITLLRFRL